MSATDLYSNEGHIEWMTFTVDDVEIKLPLTCGLPLNEIGNADRFVADCGEDVRFCAAQNQWYVWDGMRWAIDKTNRVVELAKDRIRRIYGEAYYVQAESEDEHRKQAREITKWADRSQTDYVIKSMLNLAKSDPSIAVSPEDFNRNPYLITCLDGTIDLERSIDDPIREHRREDLITRLAPRRYNPNADGTLWYNTLFGALPLNLVFFIQLGFGYNCAYTVREKAFLYLYSIPDGRKSSVLDPAFNAMGDYAKAFDYSTFAKSTKDAHGARPDIIALEGINAAQCSELPKNFVIDDALIKSLTAGNPKSVRGLYEKHPHDARLRCKYWFESNFMAKISFDDQANFNRLNVIIFNRPLSEGKKDPKAYDTLLNDPEIQDAIFTWIIDGAFLWMQHGLQRPPEVDAATKEYQKTMNPLGWFVSGYCEVGEGPKYTATATELYKRFVAVCSEATKELKDTVKAELQSVAQFSRTLKSLGTFESKHTKRGTVYYGIRVPDTWEEHELDVDEYMERIINPSDEGDGSEGDFTKVLLRNIRDYRILQKKASYLSPVSPRNLDETPPDDSKASDAEGEQ